VGTGVGCSARIADYTQPLQKLAARGKSDASSYTSTINVELEMTFTSLDTIDDRIERLDDCLGRIPDADAKSEDKEAIALSFSAIVPTIRDVSVHRDTLLQQHFDRLSAVAAADAPPSQFQASETRCTSDGTVSIVSRQLSGIELAVDLTCKQLTDSTGPVVNPANPAGAVPPQS